MIGDARSVVRGTRIETDICIVGAGAAGITVALELLGSGMRIVLLEAGGTTEDPEDQALYEGEVADPLLHSPPDKYRQRRFGGSDNHLGRPLRAVRRNRARASLVDPRQRLADILPGAGRALSACECRV